MGHSNNWEWRTTPAHHNSSLVPEPTIMISFFRSDCANFTTASRYIVSPVTRYNSQIPSKHDIISYPLAIDILIGSTPDSASSTRRMPLFVYLFGVLHNETRYLAKSRYFCFPVR